MVGRLGRAHDADAFVAPFADEFVCHDRSQPEPIRTTEGARQFFSTWITAFPDIMTVSVTRVIGDGAVTTELEWTGTNSSPMSFGGTEIPATNGTVLGPEAYTAWVTGSKVTEFRTHPDMARIATQPGLMSGTHREAQRARPSARS